MVFDQLQHQMYAGNYIILYLTHTLYINVVDSSSRWDCQIHTLTQQCWQTCQHCNEFHWCYPHWSASRTVLAHYRVFVLMAMQRTAHWCAHHGHTICFIFYLVLCGFVDLGLCCWHGSTLITAGISNHVPNKVQVWITFPIPKLQWLQNWCMGMDM